MMLSSLMLLCFLFAFLLKGFFFHQLVSRVQKTRVQLDIHMLGSPCCRTRRVHRILCTRQIISHMKICQMSDKTCQWNVMARIKWASNEALFQRPLKLSLPEQCLQPSRERSGRRGGRRRHRRVPPPPRRVEGMLPEKIQINYCEKKKTKKRQRVSPFQLDEDPSRREQIALLLVLIS